MQVGLSSLPTPDLLLPLLLCVWGSIYVSLCVCPRSIFLPCEVFAELPTSLFPLCLPLYLISDSGRKSPVPTILLPPKVPWLGQEP